MNTKISKFLNRVELDGKIYYYNSLTNALVELSSIESENHMLNELHKLANNEVNTDNKYVKLGFLVNKNIEESKIVGYECTITKRTLELGYNQQNLKEFFKEELGLPYGFLVPENFTSPNRYFDYYKFTGYENPYIEALYSLDVNSEHFEIPYRLLTKHPILHPCGLGRDIFHILSTGGIYPCQLISGMEDFKIGNLDTFDDKMFNSNIFTKMFDITLNKRCQKCWIRHLCKFCPARNFLETKSFMLNEKICQNRRKEMEEFLIEVVKIREDTIKWNELSKKIKKKRENSNASIQID